MFDLIKIGNTLTSTNKYSKGVLMIHKRKTRPTIQVVEMDTGDEVHFTLKNGEVRKIELLEIYSWTQGTNLAEEGKGFQGGITVYNVSIKIRIDGKRIEMLRIVGNDKSFYEPYEFYGLRLWPDSFKSPFERGIVKEEHGECCPEKDLRLVIQDASLRICPVMLHPWCPLPEGGLKISDCYNGDDCWLGAYFGVDAHGGLDINHQAGTHLWAPISFGKHEMFDTIDSGSNNNRWRGYHTWEDGSTWILQSHHMIELLIPEDKPVRSGEHYGLTAGALTGSHEHSHFVFKIKDEHGDYIIDPWILFWQMYEDRAEMTARR